MLEEKKLVKEKGTVSHLIDFERYGRTQPSEIVNAKRQ